MHRKMGELMENWLSVIWEKMYVCVFKDKVGAFQEDKREKKTANQRKCVTKIWNNLKSLGERFS